MRTSAARYGGVVPAGRKLWTRSVASALGPLHDTRPCSITATRSHSSRAWETCCSITNSAVPVVAEDGEGLVDLLHDEGRETE